MESQKGLPEVAGDNQVNLKQMYEESRKESARLQEQVAHLSTQIDPKEKEAHANEPPREETKNNTINSQRKNQPLSRPWLTPTPSTREAAKSANVKTLKQPIPKTSAEAKQSTVTNTQPTPPQTSAWGKGGGRRLANILANSGQAAQQAKIWNPQSQNNQTSKRFLRKLQQCS
ncbi:hypothetical protein GWI33_022914 [Rhynchophorus ferrugineus]|uniref:Uncharacterized protein n=1 Tax=Rhynchophorus ferrugineus TaxID=354439 RepID=A0A834IU21_RHYFE|nr:hypothetical protein GWI33_022914 [Rhynchophorus ferrugineus]